MIMVPEWIGEGMFAAALERVGSKGPPAHLGERRLEPLSEGSSLQTLHVGAFDEEAGALARMHHEVIPKRGLRMRGRHHEIYFSDVRKVAPEKQRTILRQPVSAIDVS